MANGRSGSRALGFLKEIEASDYLVSQGYEILTRNFYSRHGEIDIIARESGYLVFAEVKYRTDSACGTPGEAVDSKKIRRIVQTARYYMMKQGLPEDTPCRFDVVMISGNAVSVIQNAFDAV